MRQAFEFGRASGSQLEVHPSWLVAVFLLSADATAVFAIWHPTWSLGAAGVMGVIAALSVFGLVAARQLLQARVARALGCRVHRIRLFGFGGVWQVDRVGDSARAELWTALTGPIYSVGVGLVLGGLLNAAFPGVSWVMKDVLTTRHASLTPIGTFLYWLAGMNLVLALFNLLPAHPLDGGRIVRAIVWRVTEDRERATHIAHELGRVLGWMLVVAGLFMLAAAHPLGVRVGISAGVALLGWSLLAANPQVLSEDHHHPTVGGDRAAHSS